ncbi:MAG: bceA [Thermoleophilia bacterium]|nr:bceA [Thermoleophilia bacterium]
MTSMQTPTATTTIDAPAAELRAGRKTYGKGDMAVHALDGVDVTFPSGGFTAVMGPSGSGKSTLMHCLAGLDRLTSGEAVISGQALDKLNDGDLTRLRRRNVGFVFQAFNLVPTLTARENIELPLRLDGATVDQGWFDEVVARLHIADRLGHTPNELSGGQIQRVAVARALVARPAVIFADEPTGNLDTVSGAEVLQLLRTAVDEFKQTIVMVTHDPSAAAIADRVLFLVDGSIVRTLDHPTTDAIFSAMRDLGAHA